MKPKIFLLFCFFLAGPLVAQPVITSQPTNQVTLNGGNAVFNVAVSGTGPFVYQWRFNGTNLPNNIISTVAGNGSQTYTGDGGLAVNAGLARPQGVVCDAAGNLFIADYNNNRIRRVDASGMITTVAGKVGGGFAGDGGAATNATLTNPSGVGLDDMGNLFIADQNNNRIRKVDTNGDITTVAGNGTPTYAGDGGAATTASLNHPSGVALDAVGNLFIADQNNNRVRKVDINGAITTVAGNGSAAYAGDGGMATNASLNHPYGVALDGMGNLFIADQNNSCIRKVDASGIITTMAGNGTPTYAGDGGAATNASLQNPVGVGCDGAGDLYIADDNNNRVRRVDTNSIITTVAGNGSPTYAGDGGTATKASLSHPYGVALDGMGNLFIADLVNNRIRKVLLSAGYPTLTLDRVGVFNAGEYTVVITNSSGSVTSVVATLTVTAPPAITSQPASQIVAVGGSPMFSVAVVGSGPFGYLWFFAGTNLVQSGTNSTFALPDVSTNEAGNYLVVITNAYGSVTSKVATLAVELPPTVILQPGGQTVLAGTNVSFNTMVVGMGPFNYQWQFNGTNLPNNIITTVAGNGVGAPGGGAYSGDGGPATNASLFYPQGVAFDAAGNLYIADNNNDRVRKMDTDGIITTVAGNGVGSATGGGSFSGDGGAATNAGLYRPNNLAFDAAGNLYIADIFNQCIRKVDASGIITTVAGKGTISGDTGDGGQAANATMTYPASVAFDAKGNFYIAEVNGSRVRKVDTNGIITTVAGNNGIIGYFGDGGPATNADFWYLQDATFDSAGNFFVADSDNNRIRKVDTNGIITTVAGSGYWGYSGDGGAATNAFLSRPWSVVFDAVGNMYIADFGNNRIRKVDTNCIITTVAGNGVAAYSGDGGVATNASLDGPACVALDAMGNLYIADWYNNRIREVHLAGYPTLNLASVGAANAGIYTVTVTSPYGSVTSSNVTLSVLIPPKITTFSSLNGAFNFTWNAQSNLTYQVQYTTNLAAPDWIDLGSPITATSNSISTTDILGSAAQRFYRVFLVP